MLHAIRDLNASLDLSEGLKRVAETVKRSIRYDTFAVLLLDEMGRELRFVHADGFPDEVVEHWRFGIGQGIVGIAAETRKTLCVSKYAGFAA